MRIAYIDDAGDVQVPPSAGSDIQPILAFGGLIIDADRLGDLTREFLELKRSFLGRGQGRTNLDVMLREVKGADLRTLIRGSHRERRRATNFYLNLIQVIEDHGAKLMARLWIKEIGVPIDGRAVNAFSVQSSCETFQHYLAANDESGLMIIDSSTPGLNSTVSHSIFTQRFKAAGDGYDRLVEMPTFGHSENHAGLQIIDIITSGLLVPIAGRTYCVNHYAGAHVHTAYEDLKRRFAGRLGRLQYRYQGDDSRWRGGFTVADPLGCLHSGHLIHSSCGVGGSGCAR
jgi:hypothetical protein